MALVVILGAGICGLGTALLLARDGHRVPVLERDAGALPDTPQEAWDAWARKRVAQFCQPDNVMPGLRVILETVVDHHRHCVRRHAAEATRHTEGGCLHGLIVQKHNPGLEWVCIVDFQVRRQG